MKRYGGVARGTLPASIPLDWKGRQGSLEPVGPPSQAPIDAGPWINALIPPPEVVPIERNFRGAYDATANTNITLANFTIPGGTTWVFTHYGFWATESEIGVSRSKLLEPQEFLGASGKPGILMLKVNGRLYPDVQVQLGTSITNSRASYAFLTDFGQNWKRDAPLVIHGLANVELSYRNIGAGPDFIDFIGFAAMGFSLPTNIVPRTR